MKSIWKILGAAALVGLVPYSFYNKNEATGEITTHALLWKLTARPDTGNPTNRQIILDIGFHNPFKKDKDPLLMADEDDLILVDEPKCDIELTLEPKLVDESEAPAQTEL